MKTTTTTQSNNEVPYFIKKLWTIVNEKQFNDVICWSQCGKSFLIKNQALMEKNVLPMYFKHGNLSSFVRQLNMYGFRKVIEVPKLQAERSEYLEFSHPLFVRDNESLLVQLKRRASLDTNGKQMSLCRTAEEFSNLRRENEKIAAWLYQLKIQNEMLSKEVMNLKRKHEKQQEIINMIISFFADMFYRTNSNDKGRLFLDQALKYMDETMNGSPDVRSPTYNQPLAIENSSFNNSDRSIPSLDFRCILENRSKELPHDSFARSNIPSNPIKSKTYPITISGIDMLKNFLNDDSTKNYVKTHFSEGFNQYSSTNHSVDKESPPNRTSFDCEELLSNNEIEPSKNILPQLLNQKQIRNLPKLIDTSTTALSSMDDYLLNIADDDSCVSMVSPIMGNASFEEFEKRNSLNSDIIPIYDSKKPDIATKNNVKTSVKTESEIPSKNVGGSFEEIFGSDALSLLPEFILSPDQKENSRFFGEDSPANAIHSANDNNNNNNSQINSHTGNFFDPADDDQAPDFLDIEHIYDLSCDDDVEKSGPPQSKRKRLK